MNNLIFKLNKTYIRKIYASKQASKLLPYGQYNILSTILAHPEISSISGLAKLMNLSPSTLSREVTALIRKDLVIMKDTKTKVGRNKTLIITELGNKWLTQTEETIQKFNDELFKSWTPLEKREFTVLLTRMFNSLENL